MIISGLNKSCALYASRLSYISFCQCKASLPTFQLLLMSVSAIIRSVFRKDDFLMCMLDEIRAKRDEIYAVARAHKAEKLWVFGSCARKEETPESDVDFLVEFGEGSSLLSHVHLMNALRDFFGRKVDVVSTRGIHPYIQNQVLSESVAI